MFPLIPLAIAAWGAGLSKIGQDDANEKNAEEAQKNRDFQERMSNTQYQRAVADMQAAGLNPGLAYQQGGAGNVSGSTAASMQNTLSGAAQATSAIPNTLIQKAQLENIAAATEKTRAEAQGQQIDNMYASSEKQTGLDLGQTNIRRGEADIKNTNMATGLTYLQQREVAVKLTTLTETQKDVIEQAVQATRQAKANASLAEQRHAQVQLEMQLKRLEIPYAKAVADYYSSVGKYEPYVGGIKQLLNVINPFASSAGQLMRR